MTINPFTQHGMVYKTSLRFDSSISSGFLNKNHTKIRDTLIEEKPEVNHVMSYSRKGFGVLTTWRTSNVGHRDRSVVP